MVDRAHAWQTAGQYFTWYPQGRSGDALQIFYRCLGDPTSPAIVLLHGWPTSSYDFRLLAYDLSTDHYVCLLDFPGHGFSDKPLKGYAYTLRDDARLVDFFVQQIVRLQRFALLTHDRGDSVGLALLADFPAYRQQTSPLTHHLLTNGNIYLPLASLTDFQQALAIHRRVRRQLQRSQRIGWRRRSLGTCASRLLCLLMIPKSLL